MVDAEPVAVGVAVGEQPGLQHLVGTGADAGNHMARVEGRLLHVREVVVRDAVQLHAAHLDERVVAVGPHFGEVEGVDLVVGCVCLGHQLYLERPRRMVAPPDRLVEVLLVVGLIDACGAGRLGLGQAADALVGLEVELHPVTLTGCVDPLEGVRPVSVHVAPARGQAPVAEEPGELVGGLRRVGEEVPDVVGFLPVGVGVVLLGVDEVRELQRIPDEEDRRVVPGEVPVALGRVELHREASGIPHRVGAPLGPGHGGEADEDLGLLAALRHHVHAGVPADGVVGDGERAVGPGADGVDDPFGDALAVEAGELLDQVLIGEEHGPPGPRGVAVLVVGDGSPGLGREGGEGADAHGSWLLGRVEGVLSPACHDRYAITICLFLSFS